MADKPKQEKAKVEKIQESTFTKGGLNLNDKTPRPSPPIGQGTTQVNNVVVVPTPAASDSTQE